MNYYNQFPYDIFNQNALNAFIENQQRNDAINQHHSEQQQNIMKMRKAISDYCDAARRVTSDYREQAMNACLEEIMLQAAKDVNTFR